MSYKIVKNKDYLHKKTAPVETIEEGQEIANKLIEALDKIQTGLGLSANQIGISKSVSVVKVRKDNPPLVLINPVVSDASKEKIIYMEGCLSLPGKRTPTIRSAKVTITTLNHANPLPFGPDIEPMTTGSMNNDYGLLESVCVQHEIDHLNGILMIDDGVRFVPPKTANVKYGRNDKVVVEKGGETQYLKYKKALDLVKEGWKII
jgi:peptide deformylase